MQSKLSSATTRFILSSQTLPRIQSWTRLATTPVDLKDVSCVGIDGWASPSKGDDRKTQEMDDKEYFKHHKASPLSELEFADTRKPIRQAQDHGKSGGDVLRWSEEQLESAEETMMRAARVWKESAMYGIPDYPHSRALREALRVRGDYSLDAIEREFI